MTSHRRFVQALVMLALLAVAQRAGAQCGDSVRVRAPSDSAPARTLAPAASQQVFDREITLDIADRTWQRDTVEAGVALGASGVAGTQRAPWRACAGASVSLGRVTATLHNVHGLIRIHADMRALEAITARLRTP